MSVRMTTKDKLKRIMDDFELFAKNFIKIVDNNGDVVPFILNEEQKQFMKDKSKYNIILKGRQIGFSTLVLNLMVYSAIKYPNTAYLIMTHNKSVTNTLFRKLKKVYDRLPHDKYKNLFPKIELSNRDEFELTNGSRIIISTAGGGDNISGNTFQLIHLSEMAKYPSDKQEEIIATSIPALAKNPDSAIIIESTAFGENLYKDMFMKAWRNPSKSVWKPFFYSWLAKAYSKQYKHTYDEAEEFYKSINFGKRMTYEDLDETEKVLYNKYGATYRQLMFRQYFIDTKSLEKFQREFPTFPEEAFQNSSGSIFSPSLLAERIENALEPLPVNEVMNDAPELLKKYVKNGQLKIWYLPKSYKKYFAGCDVASGVTRGSGDYSTMTVIDEDGEECAVFAANDVAVHKFSEIINELGLYYQYASVCVEANSFGASILERLVNEYQYENLFRQRTFDPKSGRKRMRWGWHQNSENKIMMIVDMKQAFEEGFLLIHNPDTLREMQIFVQDEKGRLGNINKNNKNDDLVISTGLAYQAKKKNIFYV